MLLLSALNNAGWAAAIALVVAAAGRALRRRPALVHGLWVLVLLKLVTPSLVLVHPAPVRAGESSAIGPAPAAVPAETPGDPDALRPPAAGEGMESGPPAKPPAPPPPDRDGVGDGRRPWRTLMVAAWLVGTAAWIAAVAVQAARFRRLLRAGRPGPDTLVARVGRLSSRMGVRGPAVWIVPAPIPPMLWALFGPPRLILPEELWGRLDGPQQDSVLLHELAHLKRRDHWVRRLEAVVLGLYWWNPVAWWARRRVEEAEEQCCDAWVAWASPEAVDAYAEALVKTAVFLSGSRTPPPVGATGVGRVPLLQRRLSMILRDPPAGDTARRAPKAALILGGLGLLLLPGWAPGLPPEPARADVVAESGGPAVPGAESGGGPGEEPGKSVQEARPSAGAGGQAAANLYGKEVASSRPLVREVADYSQYVGSVEAAQTIEIRAAVGGVLTEVRPADGKVVEKGELLFTIDDRPYRAEAVKAEAEVERAEVRLKGRLMELEATVKLRANATVSQREVARDEGERDEAVAALKAAKASLDIARLKLESTRITAPIRGRLDRPRLSTGSQVSAGDAVLATITSTDPMCVAFNVPESTALKLGREKRGGGAGTGLAPGLPVLIGLADEDGFPRRGQIESVDARFDPRTGTLGCRAVVPDPEGLILPGMSARVLLTTGTPRKGLLVREEATQGDERGSYVLVVNDQGLVERRAVELGWPYDGLREVREGLREDDWVIVSGFDEAKAGATVRPKRIEMQAPTSP